MRGRRDNSSARSAEEPLEKGERRGRHRSSRRRLARHDLRQQRLKRDVHHRCEDDCDGARGGQYHELVDARKSCKASSFQVLREAKARQARNKSTNAPHVNSAEQVLDRLVPQQCWKGTRDTPCERGICLKADLDILDRQEDQLFCQARERSAHCQTEVVISLQLALPFQGGDADRTPIWVELGKDEARAKTVQLLIVPEDLVQLPCFLGRRVWQGSVRDEAPKARTVCGQQVRRHQCRELSAERARQRRLLALITLGSAGSLQQHPESGRAPDYQSAAADV
mmetsp:Transcript_1211/g.4972  ORF Transcript_1211/g.4972 Transcript_1211/m.4972 type:complete len:282 (+) Transcript_1211:821-1666(+)